MRKVTIFDRSIDIRPLTRKEIRELKKFGFGQAVFLPSPATVNEAWDAVFDLLLTKEEQEFLDSRPNADSHKIWQAALAETYSTEEEEKNLQSTGNGTTIEKE